MTPISPSLFLEFDQRLQVLQETDVFSRCEPPTLSQLAQLLDEIELPEHYPILQPGDWVNHLYILVTGKVRLHTGPVVLAELSRGACFGELTLAPPQRSTIAITTLSPACCLVLKSAQLAQIIDAETPYTTELLKALSKRQQRLAIAG